MMSNSPKLPSPFSLRPARVAISALLLAGALSFVPDSARAQNEGDYLYNVAMLQAAPGHFADFMAAMEASFDLSEEAGDARPFWIRHSQGDVWDFMVIYPMGDFQSYYSADRVARRSEVWNGRRGRALADELSGLTSYTEEWYSRSVPVEDMARRFDGMGFFHVEIMAGLPGSRDQLLEERRMENNYLGNLDRQENLIFVRETGSNWDVMTLGFYESLQTYAAAAARHSAQEQDEAARDAGFEDSGQIGPYLRSLMARHHDTLAVRIP